MRPITLSAVFTSQAWILLYQFYASTNLVLHNCSCSTIPNLLHNTSTSAGTISG